MRNDSQSVTETRPKPAVPDVRPAVDQGERTSSYQRRWFILKGNLLFYKDRPDDRDPVGVIVVEGCTVQLCESEEQFAFSLVWSEPGLRTYKLAAEDESSQESWIKALLVASHSYLTLLLKDMEKQYRDVLEVYSSDPAKSHILDTLSPDQATVSATWQSTGTSAFPHCQAVNAAAEASFTSGQKLWTPPTVSRSANRKSPKLWPKRNANVVPINAPAPPLGECPEFGLGAREDFGKLHEDFGKEVKELMADWLKRERGDKDVQEGDLINFG
ncbi:sesquipedalian-1-like isoform X2 [Lampris incognitus]|uniref:sesquipedalian-1-like isoform X2 n=1 Tax=Lampris incognitus TaxID=2546036 RepID=UPI0024B48849|nr:sesquipedalian-1-like isoform X2 [Lampris incognitus]